jgi:hypothetical protein
MMSSFLKAFRGRLDSRWVHDSLCKANAAALAAAQSCCDGHGELEHEDLHWLRRTFRRHPWTQNGIRALLSGVALTLDYFNMLIAMTFNIGLFVAVVGGYMLGTLLFSHLIVPAKKAADLGAWPKLPIDREDSAEAQRMGKAKAADDAALQQAIVANRHCEGCC